MIKYLRWLHWLFITKARYEWHKQGEINLVRFLNSYDSSSTPEQTSMEVTQIINHYDYLIHTSNPLVAFEPDILPPLTVERYHAKLILKGVKVKQRPLHLLENTPISEHL